jgi:hypothetical protein
LVIHDIVAGSAINFGVIDPAEDILVADRRVITDYIRKAKLVTAGSRM